MERTTVAFSMGDPHGVGPEVLLKSLVLLREANQIRPVVFGPPAYFKNLASDLDLQPDWDWIHFIPCGNYSYPPPWGKVAAAAGLLALESLRSACAYCRDQEAPLLVTSPLNKESAYLAGGFSQGQTEFIGSFFPGCDPVMAFFSDKMHVLLATVHIPLREVARQLKQQELVRRMLLFHDALRGLLERSPRIALCGLNPHASERGMFGDEEERIVRPAAEELNRILDEPAIEGPFPPDTIFRRVLNREFDGAVALYHDQGLIPLKLVAFDQAVNVSLGLPLIRTSPDHGTAFDIAGTGQADARSMLAAVKWGLRLTKGATG